MESYLRRQVRLKNDGMYINVSKPFTTKETPKTPTDNLFYSWEELVNSFVTEHHSFVPVASSAGYRTTFFYWITIYPNGKSQECFRVHFPRGETEREEFKRLFAYHILDSQNLLSSWETNKTQRVLKNLFNKI